MEELWMKKRLKTSHQIRSLFLGALILALAGCAGGILKFDNAEKVLENKEFDSAIRVKEIVEPTPTPSESPKSDQPEKSTSKLAPKPTPKPTPKPQATPKPKPTPKPKKGAKVVDEGPKPREPRTEDDEGFIGRRPVKDPFRPGEQVVLDISYFALDAGELTIETRPFVEVNGRKAYRFHAIAKTVSVFENFYKVNDYAETLVDFETLLPFSYVLDVKESKLLRNNRAIHNLSGGPPGMMEYWDKKITKDDGVQERKLEWQMLPYSQNIFSTLWYLRVFTLTPGKKIKFNVANENDNLVITCEVLRREKLKTDAGTFDTIVIRPSAEKDGKPHNIGQNLFWLTDDDQKLMVRMETKIKIGTIVGSLQKITR